MPNEAPKQKMHFLNCSSVITLPANLKPKELNNYRLYTQTSHVTSFMEMKLFSVWNYFHRVEEPAWKIKSANKNRKTALRTNEFHADFMDWYSDEPLDKKVING